MRKSLVIHWLKAIPKGITSEFGRVAFLNSNHINNPSYIVIGNLEEVVVNQQDVKSPFAVIQDVIEKSDDWWFGFLSYEVKDFVENLSSNNLDNFQFPLMRFFRPEVVGVISGDKIELLYFENRTNEAKIERLKILFSQTPEKVEFEGVDFKPATSKEEYLKDVKAIKTDIQQGEIYELNYCMAYESNFLNLPSLEVYNRLNELSQAPFSVYYEDDTHGLMCASPERFLRKTGDRIISQPIKGTRARNTGKEDERLIEELKSDPKELSENVMITDLVRNDLSKIASPSSVNVDELFGLYSFKTVHQLISTISAKVKSGVSNSEILKATFPMGSMTGAPKIRAMQLIEKYEHRKRGIYSGAFGYFKPNGDFDFNVVIRSITFNKINGNIGFQVGSAITSQSDPAKEYEECLVKAEALFKATKKKNHAGAL